MYVQHKMPKPQYEQRKATKGFYKTECILSNPKDSSKTMRLAETHKHPLLSLLFLFGSWSCLLVSRSVSPGCRLLGRKHSSAGSEQNEAQGFGLGFLCSKTNEGVSFQCIATYKCIYIYVYIYVYNITIYMYIYNTSIHIYIYNIYIHLYRIYIHLYTYIYISISLLRLSLSVDTCVLYVQHLYIYIPMYLSIGLSLSRHTGIYYTYLSTYIYIYIYIYISISGRYTFVLQGCPSERLSVSLRLVFCSFKVFNERGVSICNTQPELLRSLGPPSS